MSGIASYQNTTPQVTTARRFWEPLRLDNQPSMRGLWGLAMINLLTLKVLVNVSFLEVVFVFLSCCLNICAGRSAKRNEFYQMNQQHKSHAVLTGRATWNENNQRPGLSTRGLRNSYNITSYRNRNPGHFRLA